MRVLLVEDDPTQCDMMSIFLRRAGHEVDHAASRNQAERLMIENKYDVAVIDLVLVVSSGDTVAERAASRGMGVVVMSAAKQVFLNDMVEMLKLKGCNVSCALSKPFPPTMLLMAVNKAYADRKPVVIAGPPSGTDVPSDGCS